MNLNKVLIIGRLTRDPEARTTPNGQNVATFSLATSRNWTSAQGEKKEQTDFHRVVVWGKLAEVCSRYLVKGQEAYVEGRLTTRSWQDAQGNKKSTTEIIAQAVQFGAKARGGASSNNEPREAEEKPLPEEGNTPEEEIDVEEIPF
ncbi:MAG: single-stranded DNA-binding protein [Patescibacteria group bacterium]|nr:single-stranded DNA-binding protein [Patescibacteria group bacterium]MDD5164084.1 single-stranded DNA-binding protein [Patescibacteria group bacterium]MDD5534258.1 single-stranded DNA-binding protein [Patescibacteria group bacterium]